MKLDSLPHPRLPLLPCVVLQSAIKFINFTVPSSAGRIAINVRFLQRMGASTPQAIAAGAVDDISDKIVETALVLLTLPFVHIAVKASDLKGGVPSGRLIVTVLVILAGIVLALLLVPRIRATVLPSVRSALAGFVGRCSGPAQADRVVRRATGRRGPLCAHARRRLPRLWHPPLLCPARARERRLIRVLEPHPDAGGVGAAEASLTAGLVAMGVDTSTAFAIAFTQRLCRYYLPPIWGYFSMQWLERKAYI